MPYLAYDNGGKTADRYTIVPTGPEWPSRPGTHGPLHDALGCSEDPTSPQGFSQWGEAVLGAHLGASIGFDSLPAHVQAHARTRCETPNGLLA